VTHQTASLLSATELSEVQSLATKTVIAAGETIMEFFMESYQVSEKSPDNPVTDADLAADRYLRERLSEILPQAGWLSEETTDDLERLKRPLIWIVDPLDGTKEFVMGIPEFCVSVALVAYAQPILGIVYNPVSAELYTCLKGSGVYLNEEPAQVSSKKVLAGMTIDASRSERKRGEFEPFEQLINVRTLGSIAYKLARVAAGQADATWSRGPKNEWDICAGTLLVSEAGGHCVDLDNHPFQFNKAKPEISGIIATNDSLYKQVIELLYPYRHLARVN
jgi:myo-inositol-1(or 4)-monophosphatase